MRNFAPSHCLIRLRFMLWVLLAKPWTPDDIQTALVECAATMWRDLVLKLEATRNMNAPTQSVSRFRRISPRRMQNRWVLRMMPHSRPSSHQFRTLVGRTGV
jgi:hypothetical protein